MIDGIDRDQLTAPLGTCRLKTPAASFTMPLMCTLDLENRKNELVNAEEKTVKNRTRKKLVHVELATSFYDIGNDGPSPPA